MNIVIGERCSGKTTRLIQKSAETGAVIVAATAAQAERISKQAIALGFLDIPEPISAIELLRMSTNMRNNGITNLWLLENIRKRGILIDEAQNVLQNAFAGCRIDEITLTDNGDNIEYLKEIPGPRMWGHIDEITMGYNKHDVEYLKELPRPRPRMWGQPVIPQEQVAFVTTDGDEKDDDLSSGLGELIGYTNVRCPKCKRWRVEYWSCCKHICEKCHWCIEDNEYSKEHRM